jgi:hypothetical protein
MPAFTAISTPYYSLPRYAAHPHSAQDHCSAHANPIRGISTSSLTPFCGMNLSDSAVNVEVEVVENEGECYP